jgi:cysteine desulfurase
VIYLDHNATTPVAPEVREAMAPFLADPDACGNPSALHAAGKRARRAVESARAELADLLGARPEDLVFTGGGTESLNTALHAAALSYPERSRLVLGATEHSAVSAPARFWERSGREVVVVPVDRDGLLDLERFDAAVRERPAIAAVMWANNETGVLTPIREVAERARAAGALLVTDAVQAVGKVPVDLRELPVGMLALSAHKFHGPKGVGALWTHPALRFTPLLHGGGQEHGRRSGTENVPGIVGLGRAASLARSRPLPDPDTARRRDRFEHEVRTRHPEVLVHGKNAPRLPNTSNLAFPGRDGEAILILLDEAGVCVSPGSACSSGARAPSPVLTAMGLSPDLAKSSVRFSWGRDTTDAATDAARDALDRALARIDSVFPRDDGPVRRRS